MPELPEVECLTRNVRKALLGGTVERAEFLRKDLRWPIPIARVRAALCGETVDEVFRRSKYMLVRTKNGLGVFHLGMTGNMLVHDSAEPQALHTHAIFHFRSKAGKAQFLHFVDPRRFGVIDCVARDEALEEHSMFKGLGVEPLAHRKLAAYLFERSRAKKQPVKAFLMDARVVVGVGNIYASESLFTAGIHPLRAAGRVSAEQYHLLAAAIQKTLRQAIKAGGTSFRDFKNSDGNPGYFVVQLKVYDKVGEPCPNCAKKISLARLSGRSTFFCEFCQS